MWPRAALFFAAAAALFTAQGFLPHRVMLPLDLPRDAIAWKGDPAVRVSVSNRLLSDPVFEYVAWDREIRRLIGSGQFPWRNRFAGDGAHLFANPETALLFPLTWPRLMFGDRGWAITLFLKLFFAGLGMWWFARVLTGCDGRWALVSGFAYLASGYMTVWLLFPHTNVYAVLPWLGAAALRRNAALVILFAALATAGGHPETLCFGVIALAILILWEERSRAVAMVAACAAIGFFLIAVQLLPFLIALSKSDMLAERAHRPAHARLFAIPATILPGYLGSPLAGELDLSGIWTASENFSERSGGYAGAVALIVVACSWRRLPRKARRGMMIGVAALVLSWLSFSIAATERLGMVFTFFVTASLGSAIEQLEPRRRSAIAIALVAACVLIPALLLATPIAQPLVVRAARAGIALLQKRHYLKLPAAIYEARLAGYLAGFETVALRRIAIPAACVLAAALTKRKWIVAAAIVVEMTLFAYGFNPTIDVSSIAPTPNAIREVIRRDLDRRFFIAAAAEVYPPNMGTIDGVRDIRSYDVLQTRSRIDALRSAGYDSNNRAFPSPPPPSLGVRWYLTNAGLTEITGAAPQPWPQNTPPDGLAAGAAISLVALAAAITIIVRNDRSHDLPLPRP